MTTATTMMKTATTMASGTNCGSRLGECKLRRGVGLYVSGLSMGESISNDERFGVQLNRPAEHHH